MRAIQHVHSDVPNQWIGDGFYVKTVINHLAGTPEFNHTHTDPFLLLDYGEPTYFAPNPDYEARPHGIGLHPHKGFDIVTVAYHGELCHFDTAGGQGTLTNGDVQWMTAGRGIMHEEFHSPKFSREGGIFNTVQLWVNLPRAHKYTEPRYQTLRRAEMPNVPLYDSQQATRTLGSATLIAGELRQTEGRIDTFSPINLWDIALDKVGTTSVHVPKSHTLMILVQEGAVRVQDTTVMAGSLVQFAAPTCSTLVDGAVDAGAYDTVRLSVSREALKQDNSVKLLLLSGQPLGEPMAGHGPFVMNTKQELAQAFHDYKNGVFGKVPATT
ncbi:pirin family protein [Psychrobacter aestuarii]|uniref:Pirin family protein n=1 Tax=Psychrobacter aestuarii TaxID=556327 RepID=A0ABN0VJV2_9GAMM|nr:pirin family protein [Psychrobacter aestuarii]